MTKLIDNPPPLPEPNIPSLESCCGNQVVGAEYMGSKEWICCGDLEEISPAGYTADQYRAGEAAAFARGVAAGRNAGLEEAAIAIEPKRERPCDCERCDCGNSGNSMDAACWDDATADAKIIRSLKQ